MASVPPEKAARPKSTFGMVNKKLNQFVQLTAELAGKASKSDVDEEFKALQATYDKKRGHIEQVSADTRAVLVGAHVKASEKNTTLYATLGHDLVAAGSDLPEESNLGAALVKAGEALEKAGDYTLDMETKVRESFLVPMLTLQENEMKEIQHQKRKLENRRLDYDAKRNAYERSKKPEAEADVNAAKAKFAETIQTLREMMSMITTNEEAELDQLAGLIEGMRAYFASCHAVFEELSENLRDPSVRGTRRIVQAAAKASTASLAVSTGGAAVDGADEPASAAADVSTPAPAEGDYNPFLEEGGGAASPAAAGGAKPAGKPPKPAKPEGGIGSVISKNASSFMDKFKGGSKKEDKPTISIVSAEPMGGASAAGGPAKPPKDEAPLVDAPALAGRDDAAPASSLMDAPVPKPRQKASMDQGPPKFQALFDFVPDQDDELPFKKGDIVTLLRKVDDGWWIGEFNGRKGLFPANFVGPL